MSEIDNLRRELADLRSQVSSGFSAIARTNAKRLAREKHLETRLLEGRLAAGDLRGGRWNTRKGQPIESDVPAAMPLMTRLRGDYEIPAGTLDRLSLSTVGLFDAAESLDLGFFLPGTDYDVYECYIGIFFRQFYATATAAAAGGSTTPTTGSSSSSSSGSSSASSSGASSATTTGASNTASSGASSSSSSGASSSTTTGASDTSSSSSNAASSSASTSGNNAAASSDSTTGNDGATHSHTWATSPTTSTTFTRRRYSTNGPDVILETQTASLISTSDSSAPHDHGMAHTHSHSHSMTHTHSHSHNIEHQHTMPHTHGIGHTHDIPHTHNLPHTHDIAHTHGITHTHSVTISSHTHDLSYGIYKEAMPASWSVKAYLYELVGSTWTLRHTSDAITDLQAIVDLSDYVTGAGYWQVSLKSDAAQPNNGRLSAQVYGTVVGAVRTA